MDKAGPAAPAVAASQELTAEKWREQLRELVGELAAKDARIAVLEAAQPERDETVTVIGVRRDGSSEVVGTAPLPASMKRRDIVREMFGEPSADQSGTEADMCLWALEQYDEWLAAKGLNSGR